MFAEFLISFVALLSSFEEGTIKSIAFSKPNAFLLSPSLSFSNQVIFKYNVNYNKFTSENLFEKALSIYEQSPVCP